LWVAIYNEKSKDSTLCPGVREVLEKVSKLDLKQVVFSATEREMLMGQLESLDIVGYFDEIIGLDNIHAASKLHLAQRWREAHPDAKILYVGDTIHDAHNAQVLGADCLLFAGGHQSRQRLEKCGFPIIEKMEEILERLI
jgi:phosphoglycolate phosphatase